MFKPTTEKRYILVYQVNLGGRTSYVPYDNRLEAIEALRVQRKAGWFVSLYERVEEDPDDHRPDQVEKRGTDNG